MIKHEKTKKKKSSAKNSRGKSVVKRKKHNEKIITHASARRSRVTGCSPWINKSILDKNPKLAKARVVIGIPTTGIIRYEWAVARWGQIIPVNWSNSEIAQAYTQVGPIGYLVDDARNIICHRFLEDKPADWLFFIDHDTILPPDCYVKINQYIRKATEPVVCGLYYAKGDPAPPLIFRGRGNSYYDDWKRGDKVRVDAVPMGCTLIHRSLIEETAKISEDYRVPGIGKPIKKVFVTPRRVWYDAENKQYLKDMGTEDIYWSDKVLENDILAKAGWKRHAKMKNPFLADTSIFCKHIDLTSGQQYPLE